jgi:hypothetical protein
MTRHTGWCYIKRSLLSCARLTMENFIFWLRANIWRHFHKKNIYMHMFEKEKKPKCLKCPLQYDQGEVIFGDGQLQLEMSTIICRKTILKPVIVRALVLNIVLSKGDIFLSFPLACTVFFSCFIFANFL